MRKTVLALVFVLSIVSLGLSGCASRDCVGVEDCADVTSYEETEERGSVVNFLSVVSTFLSIYTLFR